MTTPATSNAYYYISPSTDPYYNIALEDYLYRQLRPLDTIYMLWVNRPSVFMGRYQWAEAELDLDYLEEHDIALLRRTSGGGTVYHDLGNLNFTAIKNDHSGQGFDLKAFPTPIQRALAGRGVVVERSPRGDLRLDGYKVGGAAEAVNRSRMLYHLPALRCQSRGAGAHPDSLSRGRGTLAGRLSALTGHKPPSSTSRWLYHHRPAGGYPCCPPRGAYGAIPARIQHFGRGIYPHAAC